MGRKGTGSTQPAGCQAVLGAAGKVRGRGATCLGRARGPSCVHRNQGLGCKKAFARGRVDALARASLSPEVFKLEPGAGAGVQGLLAEGAAPSTPTEAVEGAGRCQG